ncbi:MAG: glycosyltransferase family 4 protein [Candidatus Dormibacteria bacterium]
MRLLLAGMGLARDIPGGANRHMSELARGLAQEGHQVHLLVPRQRGLPDREDWDGVRVVRFRAGGGPLLRLASAARAASAMGAGRGFDVVDSHFALYGLGAMLALSSAGRMSTFHGPWAQEATLLGQGPARARLKYRLERAAYRRSVRVVTLSKAFATLVSDAYGVVPDTVRVVPPSVDLTRFSPGSAKVARDRLGLEPDRFTIVTVRRLVPRMGVATLVEALAAAPTGDSRLCIAGDGPERDALEALATRAGVGGRVRFLGRVSEADLPDCYRAADLSAVPSAALEGYGLVVPESLACGTPALVTRVGGLPEAVGSSGLVVEPGDEGLREGLTRALTGPLPSRSDCRQAAVDRFSPQLQLAATESVLRETRRRD